MKIQELKKSNYFTVKPIAEPKESQVFISSGRTFKKDTEVYTDFIF